ncbi:Oidioi.mRNA.OKI2018_I69.XSR.g15488.t1.cds [Oikopleura dioica]|uniref:Oidioi.mRNA.OKI2018_I69.XSR.g15488.t1.cds n=1 Tax=Oikopleura dioica TaxID=34765 RepID=A0ABN7SI54_OIKDI|nr:Oidioi.mRNA.OKI2018_I69.XSR.g15488.t1.cds [Oikopleura dioica]
MNPNSALLRKVKSYNYKKRARTTFLPFFDSLSGYTKSAFFSDLISAVTVAFIRLPQGLAYGALANVPPINGLYTEFFTCLFYSFFATSRHISVGTFAVLSLMVGTMVEDIDFSVCNTANSTVSRNISNEVLDEYDRIPLANEACATQLKLQYVVSATMLCGILQVAFGIFQIGKLSLLLPRHVVQGFTTAAAFFVLTSQVTVMIWDHRSCVKQKVEHDLGLVYQILA